MARILITGASGFVGGHLIAQALENGYEVTAAIRSGSDKTRLADPRLQLLEFPMGNVAAMSQLLQKSERFDWIIHNAGITKALSQEAYREGNTENTQRFTQALQNAGWLPDKFLFVSSLAALGAALPGNTKIHVQQKPSPLTPYGESKLAAEIMLAALPVDFPWVVVQPTAVYGPWERDILTFIKLANKGLEMTIGRQSQRLSFVHAADVARAIFQVLETKHAVHRKYIISDGKNYTTEDLGAAVRVALGRKKTLKIRLPLSLVTQVAGIAEIIGRWQNKPSALSRDKLPELAAINWHCDATPLLEELNFKPEFDLFQGMKDTVNWYREHGWI